MSETPGTEAGPVTAAGRDLVQQLSLSAVPVRWYVLAIEAEAIASERERVRNGVAALPQPTLGLAGGVSRSSVLALLEDPS